ncbi:MAG: hypothetical protein ABJI69_10075 [Balneola sp.]
MSLIKCSECKKEISDKASACPNCGNPIKLNYIKKEPLNLKNNSGCINAFLIAIAALIIFIIFPDFGGNESKVSEPLHNKAIAWQLTQNFVKDKIKSPSTAEFPKYYEIEDDITQEGRSYTIHAYVDGQNSFGATLRQNFEAIVKYDGNNNWILMKLNFE